MKPLVRFEHVSKKYRIGMAHVSLPGLISEIVRGLRSGHGLRRRSHDLWALRDVSFELARGESLALVGPNGAGKSTLLKLLSRITMPTDGVIDVRGRLSSLIELGAGFHPDLTGRENIFMNGTILGLSRQYISKRFDEIVAFSELADFIDTPVKRYSSGMEVKLGFSVAAYIEPEILLVDEVLAVGDASFREKCLQRIRELIEAGTSVIFVSHNMYMVQAACKKALYLNKGVLRCAGDTPKVVEAYERDVHAERARMYDLGTATGADDILQRADAIDVVDVTVNGSVHAEGEALDGRGRTTIDIHYDAYRDVQDLHFAVFIRRADGTACCTARTKLDGVHLRIPRGRGTLSVHLDTLNLSTGSYFAEVDVLDATDSMSLKSGPVRSDWFMVQGRARSYDPQAGIFEPEARWQHSGAAAPSPAALQPSERLARH